MIFLLSKICFKNRITNIKAEGSYFVFRFSFSKINTNIFLFFKIIANFFQNLLKSIYKLQNFQSKKKTQMCK